MARGKAYEEQVGALMRKIGAQRVSLRVKKRGATGERPHEVDVHAEFYSQGWDTFARLSWALALIGVAALAYGVVDDDARAAIIEADAALGGFSPMPGAAAALVGAVLVALSWIGRARVERHVWIECKDRKRPVKRDAVIKLAEQVDEIRRAAHGWQPHEVWIASSSGFDQDAEAFAEKHGIICKTIPRD